jgi:hypothetical protein
VSGGHFRELRMTDLNINCAVGLALSELCVNVTSPADLCLVPFLSAARIIVS